MNPCSIFNDFFHGQKNFITPNIVKYGKLRGKPYYYEISSGRGFYSDQLFGVTILYEKEGEIKKGKSLCKCFSSLWQAEEYIDNLRSLSVEDLEWEDLYEWER